MQQVANNRWVWSVYGLAISLLFILALVSLWTGQPMGNFTRDPLQILRSKPWVGMLSQLGMLLWAASVSVYLLGGWLLWPVARRAAGFFIGGGVITLLLLADDLFLLHDWVMPYYLGYGERYFLLGYGLILLVWLFSYRHLILASRLELLLASFTSFGVSVLVDQIPLFPGPWHHLWEDGAKWLGIIGWLCYSLACLEQHLQRWMVPAAKENS